MQSSRLVACVGRCISFVSRSGLQFWCWLESFVSYSCSQMSLRSDTVNTSLTRVHRSEHCDAFTLQVVLVDLPVGISIMRESGWNLRVSSDYPSLAEVWPGAANCHASFIRSLAPKPTSSQPARSVFRLLNAGRQAGRVRTPWLLVEIGHITVCIAAGNSADFLPGRGVGTEKISRR